MNSNTKRIVREQLVALITVIGFFIVLAICGAIEQPY